MTKKYDVVALSAVCIDIQIHTDDQTLQEHGLQKGFTNHVTSSALQKIMNSTAETPHKTTGSPGANVTAGVALRGGQSALIGKIANDDHGKFLAQRLLSLDIAYTPLVSENAETSTTCIAVMTTPDKERTFGFTIGGAGYELKPEDIDHALIASAKIVYLDSYLWLSQSGKEAVHHAAAQTKKSGGKVAIALNDANLVARNKEGFIALVKAHGDILVGDQKEFAQFLGTNTIEETITALHALGCIAAITAGAKGAHIVHDGSHTHVPAQKVENIVDTNGAGDQFAAGFLYGLASGLTPVAAAKQGAQWAADIIQHRGGEPQRPAQKPSAPPPHP